MFRKKLIFNVEMFMMDCNREALLLVEDVLYVVQCWKGDCFVINKVHLIDYSQNNAM